MRLKRRLLAYQQRSLKAQQSTNIIQTQKRDCAAAHLITRQICIQPGERLLFGAFERGQIFPSDRRERFNLFRQKIFLHLLSFITLSIQNHFHPSSSLSFSISYFGQVAISIDNKSNRNLSLLLDLWNISQCKLTFDLF